MLQKDRLMKGGAVWRSPDGCWLSEYSWDGMAASDEYYVLNGHLWALQAAIMYSKQTGLDAAKELVECAIAKTRSMADQFHWVESKWSYYMLNPKVINPPHYLIFEKMQFEALDALKPNDMFKNEALYRQESIAKAYPITQTYRDDKYQILFPKIGRPHPYYIDTYQIKISCTSKSGSISFEYDERKSPKPGSPRRFVGGYAPMESESCQVVSLSGDMEFSLYSTKPIQSSNTRGLSIQEYDLTALLDAKLSGVRQIVIDPDIVSDSANIGHYTNTQGRIYLSGINVSSLNTIFGFVLRPTRDANIGVGLVDASDAEIFRYYPMLKGNSNNLIVLSPSGFDGAEKANLPFKKLSIYFYTSADKMDKFEVNFADFKVITSVLGLYELFSDKSLYVPNDHL
jgi:hypothetical protein